MRPVRLLLVVLFLASSISAEERSLLVSGIFADSSIVGPVLRYTTGDSATTEYAISLLGWTIDAEMVKHRSPRQAFLLSADITPVNAHSSDRIYFNGERAHELEYEASSYRVRTGLRLTPTEHSTTDLRVAALVERVSDLADASVVDFWEDPFVGIDVVHTWKVMRSESPFISSFDGVAISARAEVYTGQETWSRLSVSQRAGRRFGNVHLRESVHAMTGKSLNVVNRFIVGGSWDVLGENAIYGSRFGEFRIARGVIASAGADYALPRNWTAGVRASYLRSDVVHTHGFALNATKMRPTYGFNLGVAFPKEQGGDSEPIVYLSVIAPLYAKGYN